MARSLNRREHCFECARGNLQSGNAWPKSLFFVALPFDFDDGGIAAGEPIDCPNPAAAVQRAQGLWKVFGHAGAVAFSRTTDFEIGKFNDKLSICFADLGK
jgi:hypothetical protein